MDNLGNDGINEYKGCKFLESIDKLSTKKVTPKDFFEQYIKLRKPVMFINQLNDLNWNVSRNKWNNDYLREKCGDSIVKVEYRNSLADEFGKGQEKLLKFSSILDKIEEGDQSLYMTTQELEYDYEGRPSILSPPISLIKNDFPLIPNLFANLIVSNINLWVGNSNAYSTSGLHHDYHDNIYILLRGKKRITLYSPNEALNLYTSGDIVKIHPNGRINYKGQPTNADGSDTKSNKAFAASNHLEEIAFSLVRNINNFNLSLFFILFLHSSRLMTKLMWMRMN